MVVQPTEPATGFTQSPVSNGGVFAENLSVLAN